MPSQVVLEFSFDNPEVVIVADQITGSVYQPVYTGLSVQKVFHSLWVSPVYRGKVIQDGI